jgi:hypothetical protein
VCRREELNPDSAFPIAAVVNDKKPWAAGIALANACRPKEQVLLINKFPEDL